MYEHDYYRRVCMKMLTSNSAKNSAGTLKSAFEDYSDPALEMARIMATNCFTKEYVYHNLIAVFQEYTLTTCNIHPDPDRCRMNEWQHVDRQFKKYCEYVRLNGIPEQNKEVKYPV